MTKYFLMLFVAFVALSCSKKVEVSGNFTGGSPLERIEFIEASGVATLPLINIGVDPKGNFKGSFDAPKDGMYIMTYAGKQAMVYLKGGQSINISGNAQNFPDQFTVTGDAKENNEFLKQVQKNIESYASKINVGELVSKEQPAFLKEVEKIKTDLEKHIETASKATSPDSDVVQWKEDELNASVLGLMSQYEMHRPQVSQDPSFKVSKEFAELENKLKKNEERLIKTQPIYRNYLLGKLSKEFQTFAEKNNNNGSEISTVLFSKFLDTKKEMSSLSKDYLLAFVMANSDINPSTSPENAAKVSKIIDEKISDKQIREDLKRIQFVIIGPKIGEPVSDAKLIKADGSEYKLSAAKAKPTLAMFYASWNPYISESNIPVLKEVVKFYGSKLDFVFVNMDDTKDQFAKTSAAMMQGIAGTNVYAENGMNSQIAKDLGIYGFKLPSYVAIDKDGKIASKFFFNLGDPELVTVLDKLTGLKAPVAPEATLQNELVSPPMPGATEVPAP